MPSRRLQLILRAEVNVRRCLLLTLSRVIWEHGSAYAAARAGETGEICRASSNVTGALALSALTVVAAVAVGTLSSSSLSGALDPEQRCATASLCADAALRRSERATP